MTELSAQEARDAVAAAARRLADDGLVQGTAGNVSVRLRDRVAITATGAAFATLTADEVSLVDASGAVIDRSLAPSSELDLHIAIYQRWAAGAVVHTHAPFGTALACVLTELPCLHYAMLELGGAIRVAPYETFGTPELAVVTLEALEGRTAALMSNHGAIVYADDLDTAVIRAVLLEWACALYWRAASVGEPRSLDERQLRLVAEQLALLDYGTTRPAPLS